MAYTLRDFRAQFPNDEAVLDWLVKRLNPDGVHCVKCDKVTKHHRLANRRAYSCQECGNHYYPTAGTILHRTRTPLVDWMYAIFLMSNTRTGVSAKQLQRAIGCTYKTAWRMFHQIRSMLDEDHPLMDGPVEADETYIGGHHRGQFGRSTKNKSVVAGITDRETGEMEARVVPNAKADTLTEHIMDEVEPGATIHTDEWCGYWRLPRLGYVHEFCHHGKEQWVSGNSHTNTIEAFWGLLKGGLMTVHRGAVRPSYLQAYVNEYAFRFSHRNACMFNAMTGMIAKRQYDPLRYH